MCQRFDEKRKMMKRRIRLLLVASWTIIHLEKQDSVIVSPPQRTELSHCVPNCVNREPATEYIKRFSENFGINFQSLVL